MLEHKLIRTQKEWKLSWEKKLAFWPKNMLEKSLHGIIGEKEQKQIVEKAVKNIKKTN